MGSVAKFNPRPAIANWLSVRQHRPKNCNDDCKVDKYKRRKKFFFFSQYSEIKFKCIVGIWGMHMHPLHPLGYAYDLMFQIDIEKRAQSRKSIISIC